MLGYIERTYVEFVNLKQSRATKLSKIDTGQTYKLPIHPTKMT